MNSQKLAWSIVATALALAGCTNGPAGEVFAPRDLVCAEGSAPPCETTEPARTEADRTAVPGTELDGESRTYVVNVLEVPAIDEGAAAGVNVDGLDSGEGSIDGTCEEMQPDYLSLSDPDSVGVDNALLGLLEFASTFFNANEALAEQLSEGSLILLVKVDDIDSFEYDTDVSLQLMIGMLPDGATIELEGGVIAPGQTFAVEMSLGEPVSGDIFEGRLRAKTSTITINVDSSDFALELVITTPEVRFNISEDGLSDGVIGGVISLEDLMATLVEIPDVADLCAGDPECPALRGILEQNADVNPSAADSTLCESLSVGIAFEGTTAMTN